MALSCVSANCWCPWPRCFRKSYFAEVSCQPVKRRSAYRGTLEREAAGSGGLRLPQAAQVPRSENSSGSFRWSSAKRWISRVCFRERAEGGARGRLLTSETRSCGSGEGRTAKCTSGGHCQAHDEPFAIAAEARRTNLDHAARHVLRGTCRRLGAPGGDSLNAVLRGLAQTPIPSPSQLISAASSSLNGELCLRHSQPSDCSDACKECGTAEIGKLMESSAKKGNRESQLSFRGQRS
jgi:hypothetical protein